MTATTQFRVASNSKLFTAIAIMQLREEGKLRLDDPVLKYLPWFKTKPVGDDDGPITIEQLLSHSFGPAARGFRPLGIERVSDGRGHPAARCRSTGGVCPVSAVEILQPCIRNRWLGRREGEREAVGRLRGMQYLCAARHERLERGPNGSAPADSYGRRMPDGTREVLPFIDARGMAAATGVTSSVEDMAKFISAQFRRGPRGGSQIVSGGSWREMLRVGPSKKTGLPEPAWVST